MIKFTKSLVIIFIVAILAFNLTVLAAGNVDNEVVKNIPKQLMLVPTHSLNTYDLYTYSYIDIDSPYTEKGYRWYRIKTSLKAEPVEYSGDLLLSFTATDVIVNYFLDDYYFSLENAGMSEFDPYILIDKRNNTVVKNPGLNFNEDFKISAKDLESSFNIQTQNLGNIYILTMPNKFEVVKGE